MTAPSVGTLALDKLPKAGRGSSELSDDDKALAKAIAASASGDNAAVIHVTHKERADAEKAGAKIKRLVKNAGVIPDGKAARIAIVPLDNGKGFEVAVHFGEPVTRKPKGKGTDEAPAEAPAAS